MEAAHEQEFRLRNIPTRTVTVFPSRAHVVRDLKNIQLQPGFNQITITGLGPTVDEHSIKVEGTGSAIISDISVQLLPNQEIFDEIYPVADNDMLEAARLRLRNASDALQALNGKTYSSPTLVALYNKRDEIIASQAKLKNNLKCTAEDLANAEKRLKILDGFATSFQPNAADEIGDVIENYRKQRVHIFKDHMESTLKDTELREQETKLQQQLNSTKSAIDAELQKLQQSDTERSLKAIETAREESVERMRLDKKYQEQTRLRNELKDFWPTNTYSICITLDASQYTPVSSRRSSIASATEALVPVVETQTQAGIPPCDLSISYVTTGAYWSPCYDMQLDTTKNTATLMFDAQLRNTTSETWKDCKIVLSTSQAVFGGLQDAVPRLVPWRIKLAGKSDMFGAGSDIDSSAAELAARGRNPFHHNAPKPVPQNGALFGPAPMHRLEPRMYGGAHFAAQPAAAQQGQMAAAQQRMVTLNSLEPSYNGLSNFNVNTHAGRALAAFYSDDAQTQAPEPELQLDFQQPAMEETGLTTTYDLPGTRSLAPSTSPSKQRIARISFKKVQFSHTIVAKLRPAAFLQARLRNDSSVALLKGPVGLTLDGTFMGRSQLPLCTAGDTFTLSLGVDPTIRVTYSHPEVRRSTTGMFAKENSTTYKRAITIANTRTTGEPAILTLRDQIPMSEDEKLRVDVLQPRGLDAKGVDIANDLPRGVKPDWGMAKAFLRKEGQVHWEVRLTAGAAVKLTLEYDVALPVGELAVQAPEKA